MKKLKLITIIGTRPEIIRLSRIISQCDIYFDHILIHTGQNYDYELNNIFFRDLEIRKPDYYLNSAGKNPTETIANILIKIDKIFTKLTPDAILVVGDTNSSLSVYAAKRKKIPIFHYEAGNRCFDERVPEEINRRIVDQISDINLTYSTISRNYLINEGFPQDRVIKIGSPMSEILEFYSNKINKSNILNKLKIKKNKYFVLSFHREENIDDKVNLIKIINIINKLPNLYHHPVIVSLHPRTKNRIKKLNRKFGKKIIFSKPLCFSDYIYLQKNSFCVISDSGTISEESSILNFPAINFRESHERPEAMEEGSIIMSGFGLESVIQSINIIKYQSRNENRNLNIVRDYLDTNISEKIIRIIQSYTGYVNDKIWRKN